MVDAATFARHGWLALGPLLSPAEVGELVLAFDELVDDDVRRARYPSRDALLAIVQCWPKVAERHPTFAALIDPVTVPGARVAGALRRLWGDGPARLLYADVLIKAPRAQVHVPWHQDWPTWSGVPEEGEGVVIWIALDAVDDAGGSIRYVSGSHAGGLPLDAQGTSTSVAAGGAIAHDARTWHASGPNRTDRWRRAILLGWCRTPAPSRNPPGEGSRGSARGPTR